MRRSNRYLRRLARKFEFSPFGKTAQQPIARHVTPLVACLITNEGHQQFALPGKDLVVSRHDTDDGAPGRALAGQVDRCSEDRLVTAETALPETMAQNRHRFRRRQRVSHAQTATENRFDPENVEVGAVDNRGGEYSREPATGDDDLAGGGYAKSFEGHTTASFELFPEHVELLAGDKGPR